MSEKTQKILTNNNFLINNISNKKSLELNSENYVSSLKIENISLNSQIKTLTDIIATLKNHLSNYEIEKNRLLLSSNKKDNELKEIKQKLSQAKSQVEKLKQKIHQKVEFPDLISNNEKCLKPNSNLFLQLQNKITDLELKLKKEESKSISYSNKNKNLILSQLQNSNNISLFIPSTVNKIKSSSQNISDLFITGTNDVAENKPNQKLIKCIDELKIEISNIGRDREGIKVGLKNLTKERNDLVKILKNKNEEINNKLDQQNKLSQDLIEQLDKKKKMRTFYRKIKIKNKNLKNEKKVLEDVIFKQEKKVLKLSKSYQNVLNIINVKNEEIYRNKNYIFNLEEKIKKLKMKFEKLISDKEKEKQINDLELKIKNIREKSGKYKIIKGNKIPENKNPSNNIHNINFYIKNQRPFYKNDFFRIKQKIFMNNNIQNPSVFNSFILKGNKNNKIIINNYSDKKYNLQRMFNKNIDYQFYNKKRIDSKGNLLKHNKSTIDIKDNKDNNNNLFENINLSHSISLNKKIKYFQEEKKEKEKIEEFKSFFNKFVEELEKD